MKRNNPEETLHVAVAHYLRVALPEDFIWTSVEMGVRTTSKAAAAKLKAKGCLKGWPDLQILPPVDTMEDPQPCVPIFLELKTARTYPSPTQKALHERLMAAGYEVAVCRSVEDVERFLRSCGVPLRASVST